MSLVVGVSDRVRPNWTCEREAETAPACRESEEGEYLAEKYCEQECQSFVVAIDRLHKLAELFKNREGTRFVMNFVLTSDEHIKGPEFASVRLDDWTIDLRQLDFCYGKDCTFRYCSAEKWFILDDFAPLQHASLVMKIVKLICAACAMARRQKEMKIKLIDASIDKNGVSMFPWVKIARGYGYYEARGFKPLSKCVNMPSREKFNQLQKETLETFVKSSNECQVTVGDANFWKMTLKDVGDYFLRNVEVYDQFLDEGGAAVEWALNVRLLCTEGYVFESNLEERESVASVGGFGQYAVAWNY